MEGVQKKVITELLKVYKELKEKTKDLPEEIIHKEIIPLRTLYSKIEEHVVKMKDYGELYDFKFDYLHVNCLEMPFVITAFFTATFSKTRMMEIRKTKSICVITIAKLFTMECFL